MSSHIGKFSEPAETFLFVAIPIGELRSPNSNLGHQPSTWFMKGRWAGMKSLSKESLGCITVSRHPSLAYVRARGDFK